MEQVSDNICAPFAKQMQSSECSLGWCRQLCLASFPTGYNSHLDIQFCGMEWYEYDIKMMQIYFFTRSYFCIGAVFLGNTAKDIHFHQLSYSSSLRLNPAMPFWVKALKPLAKRLRHSQHIIQELTQRLIANKHRRQPFVNVSRGFMAIILNLATPC